MSENSPRLAMPFMQQGQAQKHVTHNEALEILDLLVQLTVAAFGAEDPPADPQDGQVWALGDAPTAAWEGQAGMLAAWANGGWLFLAPRPGWRAALGDDVRVWTGAGWARPRLPDLSQLPGIGVNADHDAENRLAVAAPAALFTHDGADHRLKINKAAGADTASIVFQTAWSGRAEMGLAGEDDFSFKVSADGAAWATGLRIAAADGRVTLPGGLSVEGALSLPAGAVARTALAEGAPRSVLGRSAGSAGEVADIAAGTDHQVLRRSGSSIAFGAVNLAQAAATTGLLPVNRGGTGGSTAEAARTSLGLTLTTGTLDATPGRVSRVGDFGVGNNGDALDIPTDGAALGSGFYRSNISGDNVYGTQVALARMSWSGARQIEIGGAVTGVGTTRFLGRTMVTNNVWRPIVEFLHNENIVGAVGQSGGTPTGAVIERGSNANGEYVRFADGTQICWRALTVNLSISFAVMGGFRSSGQATTFPAVFSAIPAWFAFPVSGTAFGAVAHGAGSTNSWVWAVTAVTSQPAADRDVQLIAVGRWF